MSLRNKLIAGFVGMSLLVGISGFIGLFYISSINQTLNDITDMAAPTVETSDDLISAIWRANTIVEAILVSEDPAEIEMFRQELRTIEAVFEIASNELSQLVDDESLLDDLDRANDGQRQFTEHSRQAIENQLLMLSKEADAEQFLSGFDAVGDTLTEMLDEFAVENEAEMRKAEEDGDLLVAKGGASAADVNELLGELFEQDYPVVVASLKLQWLVVALEEAGRKYLGEEDLNALEPIRLEFERLFAMVDIHIQTLGDLAESEEDANDARDLETLMSQWDDTVLIEDGLFDSHYEMLEAEINVDRYAAMLRSDALATADALNVVADSADRISDNADELAGESVSTARFIVGLTIFAGIVVAIGLGISIIRAITRPIANLVETVGAVQSSGDLSRRSEVHGNDEIGDIAHALNDFLESLESRAAVAANVARGILDTPNELRSQKDTLGIALDKMLAGLTDKAKVFDSVARGDLSTEVKLASDQDSLGRSLQLMLASLQAKAEAIDEFSFGNLNVSVNPASDSDVLAISVNRMIETLREVSRQADVISSGDYSAQISPRSDKDELGVALQRMTDSLRTNAAEAEVREWNRSGYAQVQDASRGAPEERELGARLVQVLSEHLGGQLASLYLHRADSDRLCFVAGYAGGGERTNPPEFAIGEGLVGQVALDRVSKVIEPVPDGYCEIRSSMGRSSPRSLLLFPLVHDEQLIGVIELASVASFGAREIEFLGSVEENLCIALRAARSQDELRILLAHTRQQAVFFRLFTDSTDPIVLEDLTGNVIDLNDAAEEAYGWKKEELVGQPTKLIVPKERHDQAGQLLRECLEGGEVRNVEGLRVSRDGTVYDVLITFSLLRDENDEATAVASIAKDISSLRHAQDELKSLNRDLEHKVDERTAELAAAQETAESANRAKSAFLANMSHELRTPMNAILGYSEMLVEEAEDIGQEDFIPDLQKINQAGSHLLALINDVLDLSKIESGKMEAYAEEFNIDGLIDDVCATAHPLMEKNGNTLTIERADNLGDAHQDVTKFRQVMLNLLSNAAKFAHESTITLRVNRTRQGSADWLTIAVSDTGIGIAEDKLGHVFEEFSQADDSTTRDYGGTGLGLAISKRFCELLGGNLTVESVVGEGSTFTMHIPAILPGTEPKQPPDVSVSASQESEQPEIRGAASDPTILVIDDDPDACQIIEHFLTRDGFRVITATSGEQGLRLAHDIHPVAITLDVMMPDMDGWSVLRALKADPVLRHIPVIMLSMMDDRSRGYSLGAVDYLTKPVDRKQLHKTLSRYYRDGQSSTVMLVEDDLKTRDMMARTLEKAGWNVSEAGNGQEALDLLAFKLPDLILLDLMMPVMDGFGFLAEMRVRPEWQHIPVIVVTAKDLTPDDRLRLSGQVEQVLEKSPFTSEQLLEHVRGAVAAFNVPRDVHAESGNPNQMKTTV